MSEQKANETHADYRRRRVDELRPKELSGKLTPAEQKELNDLYSVGGVR